MNGITSFIVLVALTVGIVEVIKRASGVDKKLLPLIALAVGLLLTLIGGITTITSLTLLTGIAVGLSSSGLFDHSKLLGR